MTQTPPKPSQRHWGIAILVLIFVAFAINAATQTAVGWLFGLLAAAIAWLIFKPRVT